MKQLRHALTSCHQYLRSKLTFLVLLIGFASFTVTMPVSAAGTPYGSGSYGSGTYNNSASSTSAPNTGIGSYLHHVNWMELGGGALLVVTGIGGFLATSRRRQANET